MYKSLKKKKTSRNVTVNTTGVRQKTMKEIDNSQYDVYKSPLKRFGSQLSLFGSVRQSSSRSNKSSRRKLLKAKAGRSIWNFPRNTVLSPKKNIEDNGQNNICENTSVIENVEEEYIPPLRTSVRSSARKRLTNVSVVSERSHASIKSKRSSVSRKPSMAGERSFEFPGDGNKESTSFPTPRATLLEQKMPEYDILEGNVAKIVKEKDLVRQVLSPEDELDCIEDKIEDEIVNVTRKKSDASSLKEEEVNDEPEPETIRPTTFSSNSLQHHIITRGSNNSRQTLYSVKRTTKETRHSSTNDSRRSTRQTLILGDGRKQRTSSVEKTRTNIRATPMRRMDSFREEAYEQEKDETAFAHTFSVESNTRSSKLKDRVKDYDYFGSGVNILQRQKRKKKPIKKNP